MYMYMYMYIYIYIYTYIYIYVYDSYVIMLHVCRHTPAQDPGPFIIVKLVVVLINYTQLYIAAILIL